MAEFTAAGTVQPLRQIMQLSPGRLFALMPGTLPEPQGFGAKVITAFADPDAPGRTPHQGIVVLFDASSGAPVCIADAGEVTHIRTAAATAVATDALARANATSLTIFGCGAQARTHLRAIARVRSLERVTVWGRDAARASAFASSMAAESGLDVRAEPDGATAAQADIICTVTGSPTPVLLGEWVAPGTHVNAVGSSHAGPVEVDTELVLASRYIADSRASARAAAAELIVAREAGALTDDHIVAEIGQVLLGQVAGRTGDLDITFYKSLGHIVQDLAAVRYLHARAVTRND
ncbi:ornithine cyclodeaminase family protein [Sphingomonas sp. MG17]|uniref:Ornithine cyclodeaminase family protein n=2 Tax=Sphingomonas tagetis TaxID=2949092 RepID=A0A9X2KMK8_9SPHN|nr:ornithine cyclodeaminase family protein [Sphingomonas tagetis]